MRFGRSREHRDEPWQTAARAIESDGVALPQFSESVRDALAGFSLENIRVHVDEAATESLETRAFAVGNHIVVSPDALRATDAEDVLRHEAIHALQQDVVVSSSELVGVRAQRIDEREREAAGPLPPTLTRAPLSLQMWEGYEHVKLGDRASQAYGGTRYFRLSAHADFPRELIDKPWTEWPKDDRFRRLVENVGKRFGEAARQDAIRILTTGLTYGELMALAGDLYGAFDDETKGEQGMMRAPLAEVVELVILASRDKTAHVTSHDLNAASGGRFLSLAKRNTPHFTMVASGVSALEQYRKYHALAIAAAKSDTTTALMLNAFADHFLSDMFASGHVAIARDTTNTGTNIADRATHNFYNKVGVPVRNRRGKTWIAYGDQSLDRQGSVGTKELLEALSVSRLELALDEAKAPYGAEEYVPMRDWSVQAELPDPSVIANLAYEEGWDAVAMQRAEGREAVMWVLRHQAALRNPARLASGERARLRATIYSYLPSVSGDDLGSPSDDLYDAIAALEVIESHEATSREPRHGWLDGVLRAIGRTARQMDPVEILLRELRRRLLYIPVPRIGAGHVL